jgi:hypothetical protein
LMRWVGWAVHSRIHLLADLANPSDVPFQIVHLDFPHFARLKEDCAPASKPVGNAPPACATDGLMQIARGLMNPPHGPPPPPTGRPPCTYAACLDPHSLQNFDLDTHLLADLVDATELEKLASSKKLVVSVRCAAASTTRRHGHLLPTL